MLHDNMPSIMDNENIFIITNYTIINNCFSLDVIKNDKGFGF